MKEIKHYSRNFLKFGSNKYEIKQIPTKFMLEEQELRKKDIKIKTLFYSTALIGSLIIGYNIYSKFKQNNQEQEFKNNLEYKINIYDNSVSKSGLQYKYGN